MCAIFRRLAISAVLAGHLLRPAAAQDKPGPDLLDHWRRATVSVGQVVDDGGKQKYVTVGSAVIVAVDRNHACLLTAKHVVFDPGNGYLPTVMSIRLPKTEASPAVDFGVPVPLVVNGTNLWKSLSDGSDLAVVPLPSLDKYKTIHAVSINDFGADSDLFQGATVVVLGYPAILGEDYLSTPFARGGIIAWLDPEGPAERPFLIDANIFSGNSGGPVFRMRSGLDREGNISVGGGLSFIGIVSKDAQEGADVIAKEGDYVARSTQIQPITGKPIPEYAVVKNIGGIGVIEPASRAKQLVKQAFGLKP